LVGIEPGDAFVLKIPNGSGYNIYKFLVVDAKYNADGLSLKVVRVADLPNSTLTMRLSEDMTVSKNYTNQPSITI